MAFFVSKQIIVIGENSEMIGFIAGILTTLSLVGLFVIGFFEKLFLELLQSFVNAISGFLLSTTDHLCNALPELRLVGGLIAKERVDGLNYHIL